MGHSETKSNKEVEKNRDSLSDESNEKLTYPSAQTLLVVIQKENDLELDRKKVLETRAGVFIAFSGVLINFFVRAVDIKELSAEVETEFILTYLLVFSIFYVIPLLLLLLGLLFCVNVLVVKEYKRLGLGGFNKKQGKRLDDELSMALTESYHSILVTNQEVNTKKAKSLKIGIILISIAVTLMTIMYFISLLL